MSFSVYLVSSDGVRAKTTIAPFTEAATLNDVKTFATPRFARFVVLDDAGVQVYASDKRDETGAYIPNGC